MIPHSTDPAPAAVAAPGSAHILKLGWPMARLSLQTGPAAIVLTGEPIEIGIVY